MESCLVCERETKYTCVWCRRAICNVCSLSVVEETPGYNEEGYSIGRCPEGKCHIVEGDKDDDITILTEEPPVKKAKVQGNVMSYFSSSNMKKKEKNIPIKASCSTGVKRTVQLKVCEGKAKRSISVDTVKTSWIPQLLKGCKPELWFTFENDGKYLKSMKCLMCEKYEGSIENTQGFNREWISGTTNFRSSNVERHVKSKSHLKAMDIYYINQNEIKSPTEENQPTIENSFKVGEKILWERTKKKFEVTYFIAKEEIPFTKYEKILNLEEMHGVDVGSSYRNDKACAEFIDYLGEDLNEKLTKDLGKANFYSVLSDGSMDCTVQD